MTTILLTGATGQVGWELARTLMPLGNVVCPPRGSLDLANPAALGPAVDAIRPDVIINPAAYTAVDQAEQEPAAAFTVNGDAPGELAKAARRHGALLVHYSTDYVFDGLKPDAYDEADATKPAGVYAKSKLAGEEAIRAAGADHLILRTSWIYAARGKNFLKTILRLAGERDELRVVADQTGAPTWARLVAESTALMLQQDLQRRQRGEFTGGVFHLTASGATSWHGFASAIVAAGRDRGLPLRCQKVTPITTAEYPLPAPRPANSRLAGSKLAARYGLAMPDWAHGLRLCLDELLLQHQTG